MTEPELSFVDHGVRLALWEWPAAAGAPTAVFAHATGFHGRCWDAVVEKLPGWRCLALDMRGHGRSDKPAPPYPWSVFAEDGAAVVKQLGLVGAVGVGHSMGGYAVTRAAAMAPDAFRTLLLIDPVIMARDRYAAMPEGGPEGAHFVARRRNEWAAVDEMVERFAGREPFSRWEPRVLRDYCAWGLLPNPAGDGYVLACPPEIEAAIYAGTAGNDPHDRLAEVRQPVRILRARIQQDGEPFSMALSPTDPDLAQSFPSAQDVYLPQFTHFIPMEAPALVAEHVRSVAGA